MESKVANIFRLLICRILIVVLIISAMYVPFTPIAFGEDENWYSTTLKGIITPGMTDLEKLEAITKYVAHEYDYNGRYSSAVNMVKYGGGDCWASTEMVSKLCDAAGLENWERNAKNDPLAGSGHVNTVVKIDGKFYVADAGYAGTKPRPYTVTESKEGFSVLIPSASTAIVYQYDGDSTVVSIPSTIDGRTVTRIGTDTQKTKPESVFSTSFTYKGIKKITIPATVEDIAVAAFYGASDLEEIIVDPENPKYSSINGGLYSKDGKTLYKYPSTQEEIAYIPDTVTRLGPFAFSSTKHLKTVCLSGMTAPKCSTPKPYWLVDGYQDITFVVPEGATGYDVSPWTSLKVKYAKAPKTAGFTLDDNHINKNSYSILTTEVDPEDAYVEAEYKTKDSKVASVKWEGLYREYRVYGENVDAKTDVIGTYYSIRFTSNGAQKYKIGTVSKEVTVGSPVTGVNVNRSNIDMKVGESAKITASVMPSTANQNVNWSSSDSSIVSVDSDGKVTALKPGKATITAKTQVGGYTARCEVTVKGVISSSTVTVTGISDKTYDGKAQTQSVSVSMTIGGKNTTLKNGEDYSVSYQNNVNPGTASIIITGKGLFEGSVTKNFTIKPKPVETKPTTSKPATTKPATVKATFRRIDGGSKGDRYDTGRNIALAYKKDTKVTALAGVVVVNGQDASAADSFSAGAVTTKYKVPTILTNTSKTQEQKTLTWIKKNVKPKGKVYIVGGNLVVSDTFEKAVKKAGYTPVRIAGKDRIETNLATLRTYGIGKTDEVLVANGWEWKNALVASATGKPVLLVNKTGLTTNQKKYLDKNKVKKFTLIGNSSSISQNVATSLKSYTLNGKNVERVNAASGEAMCIAVAKKYWPKGHDNAFVATANTCADALSGGPECRLFNGPLFLVTDKAYTTTSKYLKALPIKKVTVFGGPLAVSNELVKKIANIK